MQANAAWDDTPATAGNPNANPPTDPTPAIPGVGDNPAFDNLNDDQEAFVKSFYVESLAGGTDYRAFSYVLRHTSNVPNRWAVQVQDWGNGLTYSIGQMLNNELLNDQTVTFSTAVTRSNTN